MSSRIAATTIAALFAASAGWADLKLRNGADLDMHGSAGSQIIFPDGTSMSSVLESGLSLPAGHGGIDNTVSGQDAYVGGGRDNTASADYASVGGGQDNVSSDSRATVSGGRFNTASGYGSTVGGGVSSTASQDFATVGGGGFNAAFGLFSTVGGGTVNFATGYAATVGGGESNTASGNYASVGGGDSNTASGSGAVVGGGYDNIASGLGAAVGGGLTNTAGGDYSFAAGRNATIAEAHDGTFLFADRNHLLFNSAASDEFAARATGGVRFVTGIDHVGAPSTGVSLVAGGTSWDVLSARDAKENFADIDAVDILDRLAGLTIQQWNYKANDESVKHIGPIAEDFHEAFGLSGPYTGRITTQDFDGIALAAIQGVNAKLEAQLAERDASIADLHVRNNALEARLAEIESKLNQTAP